MVDMLLRQRDVDVDGVTQRRLDWANVLAIGTKFWDVQRVVRKARAAGAVQRRDIIQRKDPGGIVTEYAPFSSSYLLLKKDFQYSRSYHGHHHGCESVPSL